MQFYILMVDYGRGARKPTGLEAVVSPEFTRRQIVEEVRDILISGDRSVAFVKFVDGNFIEDLTEEITSEAWSGMDREAYNAARLQAAE